MFLRRLFFRRDISPATKLYPLSALIPKSQSPSASSSADGATFIANSSLDFKIQNIVGLCDVKFPIRLEGKIVITRAKMRKETYTAFENIYTQFLQSSGRSSNNSIEGIPPEAANSTGGHAAEQVGSEAQEQSRQNASEHPSDHTRVWSELSGTGNNSVNGTEERPQGEGQPDLNIQGIRDMGISKSGPAGDNVPAASNFQRPTQMDHTEGSRVRVENNNQSFSQRHPSNWVDASDDEDDEDGVDATPPHHEDY